MKNRRLLLHLFFWLAYSLYDGYLGAPIAGSSYAGLGFLERLRLGYTAELCLLVLKVPAVYLVLYVLVPGYFKDKKLWKLALGIGIVAATVAIVNQKIWFDIIYPLIYHVSTPEPAQNLAHALSRLLWSLFDILMLLGVTTALKFFRHRMQAAEREKQLVAEKLQSELQFLRAQTNPHFLFNTLNNLYHLARKRSEDTPEAILKLSSLMRFMLHECAMPSIRISQEVKVLHDYLELEALRYGDRLQVAFQVEMDDENRPIAPLLLLPFVENAFKHGASESRGQTWVSIALELQGGQLRFTVENPKDADEAGNNDGIGLKNVKRQLELLYPNHELSIDNQRDRFKIDLKISLDK
jgi:LytS/YehU family sensor histidine kinase